MTKLGKIQAGYFAQITKGEHTVALAEDYMLEIGGQRLESEANLFVGGGFEDRLALFLAAGRGCGAAQFAVYMQAQFPTLALVKFFSWLVLWH